MDLEIVGGNPKGTEALIPAIVTWVTAPLEESPVIILGLITDTGIAE